MAKDVEEAGSPGRCVRVERRGKCGRSWGRGDGDCESARVELKGGLTLAGQYNVRLMAKLKEYMTEVSPRGAVATGPETELMRLCRRGHEHPGDVPAHAGKL